MLSIVTALRSEAHSIIEHLSLKPLQTHSVPHIYGSDSINLVISGVGQAKSQLAIEHLAAFHKDEQNFQPQAWINIGVAGHRTENLGRCFIVDKIMEQQSGETSYPSIPYRTTLASSPLCTVSAPENHYQENTLYDMEGFSFFSIAQRHTPLELIVLLKIVSDNQEHPLERINSTTIKTLIAGALPSLDEILRLLQSLLEHHVETDAAPEIAWENMWHTTYAQRQILDRASRKLRLLDDTLDVLGIIDDCKNAPEAIRVLKNKIEEIPLRLVTAP